MGVHVIFKLNAPRLAIAPLLCFAALVAAPASSQTFAPPPAKEGYSYPESYCSNRGHRVEMGDLSCLRVGGRVFLARCGMSSNTPVWRTIQDRCPPELDKLSDAKPEAKPTSSQDSDFD